MPRTPLFSAGRWRRARLAAGALALIAIAGLALAHAPFVRGRVLRWIAAEAAARGVRLEAGGLHYNLLALSAELEQPALASTADARPFFTADRARIDADWSPLSGLSVQLIDVASPRVTVHRDAGGDWNLPATSGGGSGGFALPVRIERATISNLVLDYADAAANLRVSGGGFSLNLGSDALGRLSGRLAATQPTTIAWADRSTTIEALGGGVMFDGAALHLDAFEATAPEGRVRVSGSMGTSSDGTLALESTGALDASRLMPWLAPEQTVEGTVEFAATLSGALEQPAVTFDVKSPGGLSSPELGTVPIAARGTFSGDVLALESLTAAVAGGELQAQGRTDLASQQSAADVRWQGIDPRGLARVLPWADRIGSLMDGTLAVEWTGTDVRSATGELSAKLRPGLRSRGGSTAALPLAGTVGLSIENGEWSASAAQQVQDALSLQLDAQGQLAESLDASPLGGTVNLEVVELSRAWPVVAALAGTEGASPPGDLSGPASAEFTLAGTLGRPLASGTIRSDDLRLAALTPAALTMRVDGSLESVAADDLRLAVGSNVITGRAALAFDTSALTGDLQAALPDLSAFGGLVPDAWRPTGAADVSLQLGGTLSAPTVDAKAEARTVVVHGEMIDSLNAVARLANGVLTVPSLEVAQRDGQLTASGTYELATQRYSASVTGKNLEVSAPAAARFDVQLTGEGSVDAPAATGSIDFARLDWEAYGIGPSRVDLSLNGSSLRLDGAVPAANGRFDATIDLDARTVDATAALTRADLTALTRATGPAGPSEPAEPAGPAEPVLPAGPTGAAEPPSPAGDPPTSSAAGEPTSAGAASEAPPVAGAISLNATANGSLDDLAALTVVIDAELADAAVHGIPVRLEGPARLRHEGGVLVADEVALHVGESAVRVDGRLGSTDPADGLDVEITGSLAELASLTELAPSGSRVDAAGAVDVRLRASGPLQAPVVNGTLSVANGSFAVGGTPAAVSADAAASPSPAAFSLEDIAVKAALEQGVLEVTTLSGRWQGAAVTGSASIPLAVAGERLPAAYRATLPATSGPARATLGLSGITPAVLAPFVDQATLDQLGGRVDVTASFEAESLDVDGVRGEVVFERADLELARVPVRQTAPTRLRLANGRLDVTEWRWESPAGQLGIGGYIRMTDGASELNLGIGGTLDLRMLAAFAPGVAFDGVASVDVRALGTTEAPDIQGGIQLSSVDVAMRDPRIAMTDLDATATFSRDRFILQRATASANGGTVEMSGEVGFSGTSLRDGSLTIAGRGLALELVDGLRTEADADLVFSVGDPVHALTGQVTIVRGDYREALRLTDLLFASRGDAAPPPAPSTEPGLLDRIRLNVAIVSADDIVVRNNYGRLDIGASLAIIGTAAAPAAAGRATIREGGQVFLGGQTYAVTRGTVDFTNPNRLEPMFDIALETRVQRNDITLELQGTPETLDVGVRSPGISQEDAVSLLLTGQMSDQPGAAYSQVARGQLLMLLSGEVLGIAGRAVGFDTVQVGRGLGGAASTFDLLATESDPGARLTLSKSLRRDVELIISQSLRETGDITWIAAYRPTRRLELRAATDDNASESYEFRHEVPFAGGSPEAAGPAAASETAPRITAVEIGDVPGIAPRDIQNQLSLEAGDRFDVYRWQDDRDRLLGWLHDRGFYEARVSARRREEGADSVALVYTIERGPHTSLRVEGHALGGETIDRMRAAWTEAVFDGFLIEDLSAIARGTLVQQGYLRAEVNVAIEDGAEGDKVAAVRIAPGPRFATRALAFRGNAAVSAADLESVVEERGLGDTAWLDSEALVEGLEAHYRSIGYLSAEVTPEAPVFEGSAATLPVAIDEGPRFRIGKVAVAGAEQRSVEDVRTLSGLPAGAPYLPAAIEPARRRIETAYLADGYNQVRVSAAVTTVAQDDEVQVAFEVAEGPQDVLERVDVAGGDHTARTTIDRAIDLEPGAPLPMSNLYAVQKRLYDLNVFQSVEVGLTPVAAEGAAGSVAESAPEGAAQGPAEGASIDAAEGAAQGATGQTSGRRPVLATIALHEMPRYRLRYGFRVVDESSPASEVLGEESGLRPGFVVDLLNRNLLGRAVTAGIAGQIESDRWLGRGILSLPFMFDLPVITNVFLTRSRQDLPTGGSDRRFVEDSTALTLEQRFRPSPRMSVTYGYTFARNHSFEFDPDPTDIPFDIVVDVARLTGTYAWDTRDDPSNASRGWFHSSAIEYGPEPLGSDLRFVRYLGQQYYFRRVGDRLVLASSLRVGAARAFGQDLLDSERFYVGGGTSVRGFLEDAVGPVDFLGDPEGGSAMVVINQEARVRLHRWVTAVGFVDAGNVFPTAGDISFLDLKAGAGGGVRITSPFAILRFDVGVPLSSRADQPKARWYFGIGQTF